MSELEQQLRSLTGLLGRLAPGGEQLRAMQEAALRTMAPGEHLAALRDLVATFSPPGEQLRVIGEQLDAQRELLHTMLAELDRVEETLARLTAASEQVRAMQEPFARLAAVLVPGEGRREGGGDGPAGGPAADDADDPDDA